MGKCKDCKWWDNCDIYGHCDLISHDESQDFAQTEMPEFPEDESRLFTREDFGCVLWEGKDN